MRAEKPPRVHVRTTFVERRLFFHSIQTEHARLETEVGWNDPGAEGYFQGVHAGKDSRSNFQGAGAVPKDYHVDPHAGRQGVEDRLDQRPLPRHMDMDVGLLGNMVWGGSHHPRVTCFIRLNFPVCACVSPVYSSWAT